MRRVNFQRKRRSKMAAVPQAMFAAQKMRAHLKISEDDCPKLTPSMPRILIDFQFLESLPLKYNDKMMMSIWNLYNRYSPHNVKQHTQKFAESTSTMGNLIGQFQPKGL